MKYHDITVWSVGADEVAINQRELAQRLKTNIRYESALLDRCRHQFEKTVQYRCAYIRIPVDLSEENHCRFDFACIESKHLYRNLQGCREVFVMAVTTGIGVDRLLARLNVTSQAEHFVTDGLSSAAVESFCDSVSDKLRQGLHCANRFSPGYGDVPLKVQEPLLNRLCARETLGITLNQAYLMTPVKSITAIMGIRV